MELPSLQICNEITIFRRLQLNKQLKQLNSLLDQRFYKVPIRLQYQYTYNTVKQTVKTVKQFIRPKVFTKCLSGYSINIHIMRGVMYYGGDISPMLKFSFKRRHGADTLLIFLKYICY